MISILAALVVFFSPNGGIEKDIVAHIGSAKSSVKIQAYAFTNDSIIAAVVAAKARGVNVQACLDKSWQNEAPKAIAAFKAASIETRIDSKHSIAHAKVIIIDDRLVYAGSYNFTFQAEHQNSEDCNRIDAPSVVKKYADNFSLHWAHSQ